MKKRKEQDDASSLAAEGKRLLQQAELTVAPTEQDNLAQYKKMFLRSARIARRLERQMLLPDEDGKIRPIVRNDVLSLSTMYSQMREIIADLRTLTDMTAQVDMICSGPIKGFKASCGQLLMNFYYQQSQLLKDNLPKDKVQPCLATLQKLSEDIGAGLDAYEAQANEKVAQLLLAPSEELVTTKSKRKR